MFLWRGRKIGELRENPSEHSIETNKLNLQRRRTCVLYHHHHTNCTSHIMNHDDTIKEKKIPVKFNAVPWLICGHLGHLCISDAKVCSHFDPWHLNHSLCLPCSKWKGRVRAICSWKRFQWKLCYWSTVLLLTMSMEASYWYGSITMWWYFSAISPGGVGLHFSHICIVRQWRCVMAQ